MSASSRGVWIFPRQQQTCKSRCSIVNRPVGGGWGTPLPPSAPAPAPAPAPGTGGAGAAAAEGVAAVGVCAAMVSGRVRSRAQTATVQTNRRLEDRAFPLWQQPSQGRQSRKAGRQYNASLELSYYRLVRLFTWHKRKRVLLSRKPAAHDHSHWLC